MVGWAFIGIHLDMIRLTRLVLRIWKLISIKYSLPQIATSVNNSVARFVNFLTTLKSREALFVPTSSHFSAVHKNKFMINDHDQLEISSFFAINVQ